MICIFVISLTGWCRMRMRHARLVSYAFLYTTFENVVEIGYFSVNGNKLCFSIGSLLFKNCLERISKERQGSQKSKRTYTSTVFLMMGLDSSNVF